MSHTAEALLPGLVLITRFCSLTAQLAHSHTMMHQEQLGLSTCGVPRDQTTSLIVDDLSLLSLPAVTQSCISVVFLHISVYSSLIS